MAPQIDFEPVRGLENWTPRGHYKIKMKINIIFENFIFFDIMILTKTKNVWWFFMFSMIFQIFDFSLLGILGILWIFEKQIFFVLVKIISKIIKFPKINFIFHFYFIMSSRCPIFKSADRLEIDLRRHTQKVNISHKKLSFFLYYFPFWRGQLRDPLKSLFA